MIKQKLTFLNHSSFIIECDGYKVLVDPYIFGSAFNNGWNLLKEVNHDKQLEKITHIVFSHEHPDHFSIPFLKKIQPDLRSSITVLYQETFDKRVKKFCENLNYNFIEIKNNTEIELSKNFKIIIGKVPFYDSWINFQVFNKNILNVNDCVLENIDLVYKIKRILNKKIDVLFTQFSYANFIEEDQQKELAKKQLEKIKIQDHVFKPSYIVPFASFIYFSNKENKFMNKNINTLNNTLDFLTSNCKARTIILKPNEEWNFENKDNNNSIKFWEEIYNNIEKLKYYPPEKSKSIDELDKEQREYLIKVKDRNNKFLIYILTKINFFPELIIYLTDLNQFFSFNLINKLNKLKNNDYKNFISLNSNSLFFIFKFDYGLDTLLINARMKCNKNYLKKVIRCFILGSLNNTGRYLKFTNIYKFFNLDFIKRGLQILGLKKRYY